MFYEKISFIPHHHRYRMQLLIKCGNSTKTKNTIKTQKKTIRSFYLLFFTSSLSVVLAPKIGYKIFYRFIVILNFICLKKRFVLNRILDFLEGKSSGTVKPHIV